MRTAASTKILPFRSSSTSTGLYSSETSETEVQSSEIADLVVQVKGLIGALHETAAAQSPLVTTPRVDSKASPEQIYRVFGDAIEKSSESFSLTLQYLRLLSDAHLHIKRALEFSSDPLIREPEMDLLFGKVRKLATLPALNCNLDQVVTALLVGLRAHVSIPYTEQELKSLGKAVRIMRETPHMDDRTLLLCLSELDQCLNLAAPFEGLVFEE